MSGPESMYAKPDGYHRNIQRLPDGETRVFGRDTDLSPVTLMEIRDAGGKKINAANEVGKTQQEITASRGPGKPVLSEGFPVPEAAQ